MIIKLLNKLLRKYLWCYEIEDFDKGFVLAKSRDDAIDKLAAHYPEAREWIWKTYHDSPGNYNSYNSMYLYDANHTEIDGDIFINVPW